MNALKLLFNPIFLLAAGLHAGLLMIPVAGGSSDGIVPAPDPEGESITVTRIPPKTVQPSEQTAIPQSRPALPTTAGVATLPQPGAQPTGASQQRPSQTSQSAVSKSPTTSSNSNTENRSNQNTNRDSTSEIAVLSSDENSRANNNAGNRTSGAQTEQAAPTLVALKDGVQSQEVPKLLRDFLARLRHSVLSTTDPEVEEAKRAWLAALSEQPDIQVSDPQDLDKALAISYPLMADDNGSRRFLSCLTPVPEKGLVGVVIDSDGAIATEPTLLRSTGYEFLNEIALAKIQDYTDFPDTNSQQLYTVDIEVDYDQDACLDLSDLKK